MIPPPPRSALLPYPTLARTAGQLAHHEEVGPLDALALQGARVEQGRARPHGPQVREQPEPLAEAEQPLLGPRLPRVLRRRPVRSEEHTSELQSRQYLVCRLL